MSVKEKAVLRKIDRAVNALLGVIREEGRNMAPAGQWEATEDILVLLIQARVLWAERRQRCT